MNLTREYLGLIDDDDKFCLDCPNELCERAIALGADRCCECAGEIGCPECYPDENENADEDAS